MSRKNFSPVKQQDSCDSQINLVLSAERYTAELLEKASIFLSQTILTRNNREKLRGFTVVQSINIHAVRLSDIFTYWFPEEYGWFTRSQNRKHMFGMQKHVRTGYNYILLQINDCLFGHTCALIHKYAYKFYINFGLKWLISNPLLLPEGYIFHRKCAGGATPPHTGRFLLGYTLTFKKSLKVLLHCLRMQSPVDY